MNVTALLDESVDGQIAAYKVETDREKMSVITMLSECGLGRFDMQPGYQRNFVWKRKTGCRLIESVMLNLTVPEIYLHRVEGPDGLPNYAIVDGRQRCETLYRFYHNQNPWNENEDFRLSGCEIVPSLNGLAFLDFTPRMRQRFLNYKLGFTHATGANSEGVSGLFQLLNQNTTPLTVQEIRNASFQGPFNDLCKNLAATPEFIKLIGKSLALRMESVQLVVRFVAFLRKGAAGYAETGNNSLEGFLSSEMEYWRGVGHYTPSMGAHIADAFVNAVSLSDSVFGQNAFRKKPGAKARISNVLFELVMCGFAHRDPDSVRLKAAEIKAALYELCTIPEFNDAISRATSDRNKVVLRFRAWEEALDKILGAAAAAKVEFPRASAAPRQATLIEDPPKPPCVVIELPPPAPVVSQDPFGDGEAKAVAVDELDGAMTLVTDPELLEAYRKQVGRKPLKDRICSKCFGTVSTKQMERAVFETGPLVKGVSNADYYHGEGDCLVAPAVLV